MGCTCPRPALTESSNPSPFKVSRYSGKDEVMPEIKERPILFNAHMVRAILEGRKTVTRRVAKNVVEAPHFRSGWKAIESKAKGAVDITAPSAMLGRACPYGKPGDRLWVRETFAQLGNEDGVCVDWDGNLQKGDEKSAAKIYRASCSQGDYGLWEVPDTADWKPKTDGLLYEGDWRPSIHMPRWASRILLEITDVRVERLQDITPEQCRAEGIVQRFPTVNDEFTPDILRGGFAELWMSTGGDWKANPWVWVIEFKRLTL